jgi:hypothetical protein
MSKRPPVPLDAVALAKAPRPPAADAPAAILAPRTCKVCGEETRNKTSLCLTHQRQVLSHKEEKAIVRDVLQRNAFRYAELHQHGAEIAAARGDTRPAEWGLLHTRMVEPLKQQSDGGKVVVQIGMVLPGLADTAPTVSVRALPGSPTNDDALDAEATEE